MRKISRTRNECATRMIAPTLNGFFARQTATEKSFRSGASSLRISSVLKPKGGTFISLDLVDGPELGERRVDRPLLERRLRDRAGRVLDRDGEPVERDGVERALHLV